MLRLLCSWSLVLSLCACAGPTARSGQMQERPDRNLVAAYESEIRAIEARYDAAWNRSDPDALTANLADDAVVVNPYGDVVQGRAAFRSLIADVLAGRFAGSRHEGSIRRIQFVAPDVALVDGEAR